jgi:hypothetical protein
MDVDAVTYSLWHRQGDCAISIIWHQRPKDKLIGFLDLLLDAIYLYFTTSRVS